MLCFKNHPLNKTVIIKVWVPFVYSVIWLFSSVVCHLLLTPPGWAHKQTRWSLTKFHRPLPECAAWTWDGGPAWVCLSHLHVFSQWPSGTWQGSRRAELRKVQPSISSTPPPGWTAGKFTTGERWRLIRKMQTWLTNTVWKTKQLFLSPL